MIVKQLTTLAVKGQMARLPAPITERDPISSLAFSICFLGFLAERGGRE
jgi:hypothetical protein